jgi:ClpX C4-type zinc finger/Glyoxalase superfamily protein
MVNVSNFLPNPRHWRTVGKAGTDSFRSPMRSGLMHDFRNAKAMAHALRSALKIRAVEVTHSDCLELIAKAFGLEKWNVLSARIAAVGYSDEAVGRDAERTIRCAFCGKSQREVHQLVGGPMAFICDGCIKLHVRKLSGASAIQAGIDRVMSRMANDND